jgi:hypothetical protein
MQGPGVQALPDAAAEQAECTAAAEYKMLA